MGQFVLTAPASHANEDVTCVATGAQISAARTWFIPGVVTCTDGSYVRDPLLYLEPSSLPFQAAKSLSALTEAH